MQQAWVARAAGAAVGATTRTRCRGIAKAADIGGGYRATGRRVRGCWGQEQRRHAGPVEVSPLQRALPKQTAACGDKATCPRLQPRRDWWTPRLQGHGAGRATMGWQGQSAAGPPARGGTPGQSEGAGGEGWPACFWQGWAGVSSPGAGKGKVLNVLWSQAGSSGTAGTCRASPSCDHRGQVGEVGWRGAWLGLVGLCRAGGHGGQKRLRRFWVCEECGIASARRSGWAAARCQGGTVGVG